MRRLRLRERTDSVPRKMEERNIKLVYKLNGSYVPPSIIYSTSKTDEVASKFALLSVSVVHLSDPGKSSCITARMVYEKK